MKNKYIKNNKTSLLCMKNKTKLLNLFIISIFLIISINSVSSVDFINQNYMNMDDCQFIGEYKINDTVNLIQSCPDCSSVNITYLKSPTSTNISNQEMSKIGNSNYILIFNNTSEVGDYFYISEGNKNQINQVECFSFKISVTGQSSEGFQDYIPSIIIFLIAALMITLGILFKNEMAKGVLYVMSVLFSYVSFQLTLIIIKSSNFIYRSGASDYMLTIFKGITWIIGGITIIAIVLISIWVFKKINIRKGFIDETSPLGV